GAAHHGPGGDRLPGLGRDLRPTRGTGPLRVGGRARDGAPGAPGHHGGALPVVEPEARERRGQDSGAPGRGVSRRDRSRRRALQQPARRVRRDAPRRPDPEAPARRRRAPRRPGARAGHAGRCPRAGARGRARLDRPRQARRPDRPRPARAASPPHDRRSRVAGGVRGVRERRARCVRGWKAGGARPRAPHRVHRGDRARGGSLRRRAVPHRAARMNTAAVLALALMAQGPADSGAALFHAWCKSCHGADGRGTPSAATRLEVPPADLRDCKGSTAEPEDRWVAIVTQGGAAFGLSLDMPTYGEAATPSQIRAVVRYARSLCGELGWPPGELNFPRAFLVEKAYPEDEVVIVDRARDQEFIYERRLGKRFQLEVSARSAFDGAPNSFDGVTGALKYNAWHSLERRALLSLRLEATPPLGRADRWGVEPFVAFGANPGRALVLQGEIVGTWEETEGVTTLSYRLGVGRELGRGTDARGRLDCAARRRAHPVPLSAAVDAAVAARTRGGVARGRGTGGGPRATPSATHRLRVVGLRGRAPVSGVVVSPSGAPGRHPRRALRRTTATCRSRARSLCRCPTNRRRPDRPSGRWPGGSAPRSWTAPTTRPRRAPRPSRSRADTPAAPSARPRPARFPRRSRRAERRAPPAGRRTPPPLRRSRRTACAGR